MPLTPQQDDDEYELRMEQMNANIAQMRANEEKLRSDARHESRRFLVQLVIGAPVLFGAGAAAGYLLIPKISVVSQAPAPTIIVNIPPYPTPAPTSPAP